MTHANDLIKSTIERWERLELDRTDIVADQKAVMDEAKGNGLDVKALKAVIAMGKKDRDQLAEEEALTQLYRDVVGV